METLSFLEKAYQFVQRQQSRLGDLQESVEIFKDLVDILRGDGANGNSPAFEQGNPEKDQEKEEEWEKLTAIMHSAEQAAADRRVELETSQKEIQFEVSVFVENLDDQDIKSLEELPDKVQEMIQNRNLLLSRHANVLRLALKDLFDMVVDASEDILPSHGIEKMSDIKSRVLGLMKGREMRLELAIEEGCAGIQAYNTQPHVGVDTMMGARATPMSGPVAPCGEIRTVLTSYEDWVETYLENAHSAESENAISNLRIKLADDAAVAAVLSLKGEGESLKKDFVCAGLTIEQERAHQLKNALSLFPGTSLMRVGRDVLEKWKADS